MEQSNNSKQITIVEILAIITLIVGVINIGIAVVTPKAEPAAIAPDKKLVVCQADVCVGTDQLQQDKVLPSCFIGDDGTEWCGAFVVLKHK